MGERNRLRTLLAIGGIALAGCASIEKIKPVAAGDLVGVDFTCRLKNGDIAVSTLKEITENATLTKSVIFLPREADGAMTITAGSNGADADTISFENRVTGMIAATVAGMTPGEGQTVRLQAERKDKDSRGQENTVKMSRFTYRPREIEIPRSEFLAMSGKAPVAEEVINLGEGMQARIIALSSDNVKLWVSPTADALIQTPYGQGTVTETPTELKVSFDAPVGTLVRSGPLVGRIAAVADDSITLDFGHPFGGEELTCDVVVPAVANAVNVDEHAGH